MAKTLPLKGIGEEEVKEIADAADTYVTATERCERANAQKKNEKVALIAAMQKHKRKVYVDRENGISITLVSDEKVKIAKLKEDKD